MYKQSHSQSEIRRYQNDFHDNNKIAHRRFFDFSNDALASSAITEIIEILEKQWISTHYHTIKQQRPLQKHHLTIMNNILDQEDIKLFGDKDKNWINNVVQGIKYMNDHGLYHRDLWKNTRNIIVWSDNKCYLIDFGLATWRSWEEDPFAEESGNEITIYQHDVDATSKVLHRYLW
jgi:tRNA A-37 threonylcarbamoyl transferase component Bud32